MLDLHETPLKLRRNALARLRRTCEKPSKNGPRTIRTPPYAANSCRGRTWTPGWCSRASPDRPRSVPGTPREPPGASRKRPGAPRSVPGASPERPGTVPGASRNPPERPEGAPERSGSDFGSVLVPKSVRLASIFVPFCHPNRACMRACVRCIALRFRRFSIDFSTIFTHCVRLSDCVKRFFFARLTTFDRQNEKKKRAAIAFVLRLAARACPYEFHDQTHNLRANVLHAAPR